MLMSYFEQLQGELITFFWSNFADVAALFEANQHSEKFTNAPVQAPRYFTAGQRFRTVGQEFEDIETFIERRGGVTRLPGGLLETAVEGGHSRHARKASLPYFL